MLKALWPALALLIATPALAQPMPPQTLEISAQVEVRSVPDLAVLSAGVMSQAPTAKAALDDNAKRMTAVIAALREAGLAERDLQTSGLSIQPVYSYRPNVPPQLTGYQATNAVEARVRQLDKLGGIIDAVVARGANQLSGPSFLVEKPDAALDSARADAVRKARARASLYAEAAGLKVKRILSISETPGWRGPMPMPAQVMRQSGIAMDAAAAAPVAPGQVAMAAVVQVVFELE
jgi:uncharacterized protein